MKKYRLTDETIKFNGRTLHRIQALRTFNGVDEGDLGGFVESEHNLSHEGNCWIYNDAIVSGDAIVCDNARVSDNACVTGNAIVSGDAIVCDNATVCDNARVTDSAEVSDDANVGGNAVIKDDVSSNRHFIVLDLNGTYVTVNKMNETVATIDTFFTDYEDFILSLESILIKI
jgi:carbonic anhydrase/acetyltransferase-like protein (isoleucine patch superfamily)